MLFPKLFRIVLILTLLASGIASGQDRYAVGDIVENFTLIDRSSGNEVELYDLEGKTLFLEWFAYWCPFCQAAAFAVKEGIVEYYKNGNSNGVPVMHIALNLQGNQETETQRFIDAYDIKFVLNDFNRALANRFQSGGQPIFAIINGVKNSPSHDQWELLYSHGGYGSLTQPISTFRSHIDSVEAPSDPDPGPTLPQDYLNYLANLGITESNRAIDLDPDFDGLPNLFEYYFGSDASDTASFYQPTPTIITISSTPFLALQFFRNASASGFDISVQFSDSPSFANLNDSIQLTPELLDNGLERIVVRSVQPFNGVEFSRLIYRSQEL